MKPGHWLALGSAIAGCAAALGIYLTSKGSSPPDRVPQAGSPRWQTAPASKRQAASCTADNPRSARASEPAHESATPTTGFRIHGKPPTGPVADERAWLANAQRVEREANRELEKLRETLELSPHQQQRIFDILAQNSPSWMPGMLAGGSHGVGVVSDGTKPADTSYQTPLDPANEVLAVLDYDQQQALIEEELNRRAWWEEILPQLLPPEFPAASAADHPAASLPGDGDTKTYQGPAEMLEE